MTDLSIDFISIKSLIPFWPGCRSACLISGAGLAAVVAGTAPAIASTSWFEGGWCEARGEERLVIDEHGLGFNEHTICEWTQGRPAADVFDTTIRCANLYPDGQGGWTRMDETTVRLHADRNGPGVITVTAAGGQPVDFHRCDR